MQCAKLRFGVAQRDARAEVRRVLLIEIGRRPVLQRLWLSSELLISVHGLKLSYEQWTAVRV